MADKQVLVSGIQPSGKLHLGNYFGAMKQFLDFQTKGFECFFPIVDLHALTTTKDKDKLSENIVDVLLDFMAVGLDPKQVTIYKQSDAPQVTELAWIFSCLTTVPYLERSHAYKDSVANGKEATVGLFTYPLLMAADILLPGANIVPVGQDQKQHVEIARDTAQKFNNVFGETFSMPEAFIPEEVAVVPGTDGRKMSKSYSNTIPLFASDEEIEKAVMSIVTDSSSEIPQNVYAIHSLLRNKNDLEVIYSENKGQYKKLKELLIEDLKAFIKPLRDKRQALEEDRNAVLEILKEGGNKARERMEDKMEEIRGKVGLKIY